MSLRALLVLARLSVAASIAAVLALQVCRGEDLGAKVKGKWFCTAAEAEGRGGEPEEGDLWTIDDARIVCMSESGKHVVTYRLSGTPDNLKIDWDTADEQIGRGIIKCDGRSLQLCARMGFKGEKVERPTKFETKKGDPDLRMVLFTRAKEDM